MIHNYISTIKLSVSMNRATSSFFTTTRGLCQGYPLSLFLFILAQQSLSSVIQKISMLPDFPGIAISRESVRPSHLMFADD